VPEVLARAERYAAAGADGLFVPGVVNADEIRAITSGTRLPVNVLAWPGLPSVAELTRLGVRRFSAGSGIAQMAWAKTAALAKACLAGQPIEGDVISFGEMNALF